MIRYAVADEELRERVIAKSSSWLARAAEATERCRNAGRFVAGPPDWSEIKSVYMELQNNKCAYCERRLGEFPIEHDIDHFRPKNAVKAWPDKSDRDAPEYPFPTGEGFSCGYFWLAYCVTNYVAACKSCNSTLKANYFPIGGQRGRKNDTISALRAEEPFLIYPIGMLDEDPAELITFDNIRAVPRYKNGLECRRAEVTIELFRLNERDLLLDERARELLLLGDALRNMQNAHEQQELRKLDRLIQSLCCSSAPHAGCKRAFRKLWSEDHEYAEQIYAGCKERIAHRYNDEADGLK